MIGAGVDFAFETTLASRSYVSLVKAAQQAGYKIKLLDAINVQSKSYGYP